MIMKKAIIYTRGYNEERQIEQCNQYAAAAGYNVIAVKTNGENIDAILKEYEFDVLIVATASRVTRSYVEYLEIEYMMNVCNVELVIVQK